MRNKYKIALVVIGILIAVHVYLGISYSLWIKTFEADKTNTIKTGCFKIDFQEISQSISLKNSFPMSDATALSKLKPYQIKLTNTCGTTNAGYAITLNTVTITGDKIADSNIKVAVGTTSSTPTNGNVLTEMEVNTELESIRPEVNGTLDTSYIIKTGIVPINSSETFNIYLWVDENAGNEVMNQKFESSIVITSYSTTESITDDTQNDTDLNNP